jgi:hypothetical protein
MPRTIIPPCDVPRQSLPCDRSKIRALYGNVPTTTWFPVEFLTYYDERNKFRSFGLRKQEGWCRDT